jgi:hypothetical protein
MSSVQLCDDERVVCGVMCADSLSKLPHSIQFITQGFKSIKLIVTDFLELIPLENLTFFIETIGATRRPHPLPSAFSELTFVLCVGAW